MLKPMHPDGFHNITSPGGYEWWYFDATDAASDLHVVAIFMQGFIFHPRYIRRHFAGKSDTAGDYPCVYLCIYRGGKIWRQFITQYPRGEFSAATDRPAVRIGPNTMEWTDGVYRLHLEGHPWRLTGRGPQTQRSLTLSADLTFTPRQAIDAVDRRFFSREVTGDDHWWTVIAPRCEVIGSVQCEGEWIDINAAGYHDHNRGTGPVGPGVLRWIWGRVMTETEGRTFHAVQPRGSGTLVEQVLLDDAGQELAMHGIGQIECDWSRRSLTRLAYPLAVRAGDAHLRNPRVIDDSPFYLRVAYEAELNGKPGHALCEIAYPHRLRWPLLGRMIEMSIDVRR